jgi:hypothetical protein
MQMDEDGSDLEKHQDTIFLDNFVFKMLIIYGTL